MKDEGRPPSLRSLPARQSNSMFLPGPVPVRSCPSTPGISTPHARRLAARPPNLLALQSFHQDFAPPLHFHLHKSKIRILGVGFVACLLFLHSCILEFLQRVLMLACGAKSFVCSLPSYLHIFVIGLLSQPGQRPSYRVKVWFE